VEAELRYSQKYSKGAKAVARKVEQFLKQQLIGTVSNVIECQGQPI